ncbi:hypothetical protein DFJ63DRAFT_321787 [Scheffersomyces coipomensis]|uniref:uncharacterized protein n=1 Tax=Scheffersomyces coipomensis TaxID=1788519 RepID=UPI00315C8BF9
MSSEGGIIKKRNKATLVCTNCKKKKIKCNRRQPCSSCVRSNTGYSCTYETKWRPVSFDPNHPNQSSIAESSTVDADMNDSSPNVANSINGDNNNPLQDELYLLRKKLNDLEASFLNNKTNSTPSSNNDNQIPKAPVSTRFAVSSVPISNATATRPSNIINPVVDDDETINFYEGYTSIQIKGNVRRVNFGPLSWASLMRKDTWLNLIWKYNESQTLSECLFTQQIPQLNQENINAYTADTDGSEGGAGGSVNIFKKKSLEHDGYNEMVPYKTLVKNGGKAGSINVSTVTLAKTLFEGRLNPELQLIEKIKMILPKKKVLWSLIDRFFIVLYPHLPFIDEIDFRKELSKIIGPISYEDEPFGKVKIAKKMDLAYISVCLILLRLTYLSLFNNRNCANAHIINSPEDTIEKYLFKNPINLVVIEVANSCIDCFQFARKSNLTVFQAVFYMRLYRMLAPEEGDGADGGDSQVVTAMLVQMAFSLGLNREPDKFDICNDEKTNHIGRKIWHFLLRSDLIHCYSVGNPTTIDMKHFDVRSPFLNDKNSNLQDLDLETAVVETFSYLKNKLFPLKTVLDMVLDINYGSSINKLTSSLNEVERIATETFYVLEEDTSSSDTNPKVAHFIDSVKSKIYLSVKSSVTTLYYHLYLHYEKIYNSELSFFYLKKMYLIILYDIAPYIFEILYGKFSTDGLILNPVLEMALHKFNQINLSSMARVNYLKYTMEQKPDHLSRLNSDAQYRANYNRFTNLSTNFRRTGELITYIFEKLSTRYYYAWRLYKAHTQLFKFLSNSTIYDTHLPGMKKIRAFQFSANQLDEIDSIIHLLGKTIAKSVYYEDRYENQPSSSTTIGKIPHNIPTYKSKKQQQRPPLNVNVNNTNGTPNMSSSSAPGSTVGKSPSGSVVSDITVTPHSSIESPPQKANSSMNHEYVDQMWMQVMAMKFDTLDLMRILLGGKSLNDLVIFLTLDLLTTNSIFRLNSSSSFDWISTLWAFLLFTDSSSFKTLL